MKQFPPPNVKGWKNTATATPVLEPGCCNFVIGKRLKSDTTTTSHNTVQATAPTQTSTPQSTPRTIDNNASDNAIAAPVQNVMEPQYIPQTTSEAHTAGCKAGFYTGCTECCCFTVVRPSHEYDPNVITDPALQAAHEKGALQGRACACIACLPTFACTIM